MKRSREDILAGGIGTKQVDVPVAHPEQVCFRRNEAEKFVFRPFNKKLDVTTLVFIDCLDPAEIGLDRPLTLDGVKKRPDRTAILVTEHRYIGRTIHIVLVTTGDRWIIG